jgi:dihydrofolate synthase/folylpolyglutamate synthase
VVAERDPPHTLREAAAALGAAWFGIGAQFDAGTGADGLWWWRGVDRDGGVLERASLPQPRLHGDNVAAALQALALAGALPDAALLARELPLVGVEGRYDRRRVGAVECVLDVAHNPAGMALLASRLQREPVPGRTVAVLGAMRDKDLGGMLSQLAPAVAQWVFADLPEARAARACELREALAPSGVVQPVRCAASLAEALEAAFAGLGAGDRVVVCGSFHTVGPALDWIEARTDVHGEQA